MAKWEKNCYEIDSDNACKNIIELMDITPDLGRKFYRLPNWMKIGEMITYDKRGMDDVQGLIVDFKVLGVARKNHQYLGENWGIKELDNLVGDLIVKFTILMKGELIHYFGSAKTWKKVMNISGKYQDNDWSMGIYGVQGVPQHAFFNVSRIFKDSSPYSFNHYGKDTYMMIEKFNSLSFKSLESDDWWVGSTDING